MEVFPLKSKKYVISQQSKILKLSLFTFFVKTGRIPTPGSLNCQFLQNSKNSEQARNIKLKENFSSFFLSDKKKSSVPKFFLLKLRQTLCRYQQKMKHIVWKTFSSFIPPIEPLQFQFISVSIFRWNSNFQSKKKKPVGDIRSKVNFSFGSSEKENKCFLHFSQIHIVQPINATWCLFDSLNIKDRQWISKNHIFWFLKNFSTSSHIILFRKPVELSFQNINVLQTNLSSLLQSTLTSRPKQYVSMVEQQIKPPYLDRFKPITKILQKNRNKKKK